MLSDEELYSIKGGASKSLMLGVFGVLVTFIIGVYDGYMRPLKCNA